MNRIILASNNKNKLREMKEKLGEYGIEVISQAEAGINIEVEETGTTFKENAILKATEIFNRLKMPVIADDSGLEVDALDGKPGVYSARFCGPNATSEDKYNKILDLMKDIQEEKRTARFKCAICYIDENGDTHIFEKACEGKIAKEPHGTDGFGYDPIFLVGNKTFAEMSGEEKNKISHRGLAVNALMEYISKKQ